MFHDGETTSSAIFFYQLKATLKVLNRSRGVLKRSTTPCDAGRRCSPGCGATWPDEPKALRRCSRSKEPCAGSGRPLRASILRTTSPASRWRPWANSQRGDSSTNLKKKIRQQQQNKNRECCCVKGMRVKRVCCRNGRACIAASKVGDWTLSAR